MPRRRKTQAIQAGPDQPYGQGGELMAAQRALPLEDTDARREAQVSTGGAAAPPQAAPAAPVPGFDAALAAARAMAPPRGELAQPFSPNEAVPTGRAMSMWTELAAMTGDPSFLDIALRARLSS